MLRTKAVRLIQDARNQFNKYGHGIINKSIKFPIVSAVSSKDIVERMEAAYHDPAAEEIENRIVNGKYDLVNDLCKEVSLPGIFKRIFIDDINYGALYYSGSAMFWLEPLHKEILSRNTTLFDDVLLTKGTILIQAFGQKGGLIGRVAWAGKFLDGACTTHMLVRVIPKDDKYSGYLFAYLSSDVGYAQIIRLPFGGSIPHFTEKDIARLPVPLMAEEQVEEINNNTLIALAYRDEALECEQEARRLVGTAIREGSL